MEALGRPARPHELLTLKPAFVYDAINMLLAKSSDGELLEEDIRKAIEQKIPEGTKFVRDWMNFEDDYEKFGWAVSYHGLRSFDGITSRAFYAFKSELQRKNEEMALGRWCKCRDQAPCGFLHSHCIKQRHLFGDMGVDNEPHLH